MSPIPKQLLRKILDDPYYKKCARADKECKGRITFEHAFIYAGKQIQEEWAIIPLCWHHHLGEGLDKGLNQLLALRRATEKDLEKYPRRSWRKDQAWLETKYPEIR